MRSFGGYSLARRAERVGAGEWRTVLDFCVSLAVKLDERKRGGRARREHWWLKLRLRLWH